MLSSYVNDSYLERYEDTISQLLRTGETSYETYIRRAKTDIAELMIKQGRELLRLCTPLNLATDSYSNKDEAQRRRIVLEVNSASADAEVTVYGRNTADADDEQAFVIAVADSEQYVLQDKDGFLVLSSEGLTLGTEIVEGGLDSAVHLTKEFEKTYYYYKYEITAGEIDIAKAYLIETSFERPHAYLSLAYIFNSRIGRGDNSLWEMKRNYYQGLYDSSMKTLDYTYDTDLDGHINELESKATNFKSFFR